jgi:hypothetical protein
VNIWTRQDWERGFENHRDHARMAILIGFAICGVGAIGVNYPEGTQPLALGSLRPALELCSQVFFGIAGPAVLLYGIGVATGLLYLGHRARLRAEGQARETRCAAQSTGEREAA